jgi:small subunit ribosomal protein SAe
MSSALSLKEEDVKLFLTAQVHVGTHFCDPNMERYVFKRKHDGTYILNLGKTWEKLVLAARAIVAIENPLDVIVISGRTWGQRAVFKFAQHTGAQYVAGRYTPGTFTNQIQKKFIEPRLLIVTDPISDHQPVKEASLVNVPVIAFCDTDAPLAHVDIAIPCNNKHKAPIALMYWLLAREVLRMRSQISRTDNWAVPVELFVYRDPEQAEKEAKEAAEKEAAGEGGEDTGAGGDQRGEVEDQSGGGGSATTTTGTAPTYPAGYQATGTATGTGGGGGGGGESGTTGSWARANPSGW